MALLELGVLLPFFFVLALVYGSLEISGTFKNRGVKGLISVVLAFFAISSAQVVELLYAVMPYATIFFLGFFMVGFLLSFLKDREGDYGMIIMVLAMVVIFMVGEDNISIINMDNQNFMGMMVVLAIVLILYIASQSKSKND